MKAKADDVRRLASRWDPALRLLLLHGADESASREMAASVAAGLRAELTTLSAGVLETDPGRLADEAASLSMFGDARLIRIDAGDAAIEAVALLLAAPAAGNPVVAVAGALRKDHKLRLAAEASPLAMAVESWPADARAVGRLAETRAADMGLRPTREALKRLLAATGGDRALMARELEKFALWLDASPDAPQTLDVTHLAALGADNGAAETDAFALALLGGQPAELDCQLGLLTQGNVSAIPVLRALARRLMQLADVAHLVAAGQSPADAAKAARVFWKEADAVAAQARHWRVADINAALARVLALERAIKAPGSAGDVLAWQGLAMLAAQAGMARGRSPA